jgi:hypothetical protein
MPSKLKTALGLTCGHVNKQFWPKVEEGEQPKRVDLACDLPKDHKGDHAADYPGALDANGKTYKRCSWSDAAGKEVQ